LEFGGSAPGRAFLKVAPPDDLPCLTHERRLMRAEIDTLERVAAAGVGKAPAILAADVSRAVVDRDAVFIEHLEGNLLSVALADMAPQQAAGLRRELAGIAAAIQAVTAPTFGYPHQAALQAPTWREAFGRMLDAVLDDALRLDMDPPLEPLRSRLRGVAERLDIGGPPRLIHYDLWDGNVLVSRGEAGWSITGLIDWERAFYGDPLAEIVSLTFHSGMAADADLLAGWSRAASTRLVLDAAASRRLALYRAYLWLLMLVEAGPRGFLITQPPAKWDAIRRRLDRDLAAAEAVAA
ncbi:MAG TPA: aminoglycoside phosphotransferase family protein, partial [Caulobacteraceae bacterium]|nr:aminoglycoside phosphotransferase family protein [Caulobacteraceae bacterium]